MRDRLRLTSPQPSEVRACLEGVRPCTYLFLCHLWQHGKLISIQSLSVIAPWRMPSFFNRFA